MPPTTLADAFQQILQIPAVAQLYEESDRLYIESLLTLNRGTLKTGGAGYRIHATAASYLGGHPELRFVRLHDGTQVGDIDRLIASLNADQEKEDAENFVPASPINTTKFAPFMTVSLRGSSEP